MSFSTESQFQLALADVRQGVARTELWAMLGWHDIRQRFRRSILGPFWITLSTAVVLVALGFIYATIFRMELREYMLFLAIGLVTWTFLSGLVLDGCQAFIASDALIKQIRLPLTLHACRVVWRNLLIFLHNAVIIVAVIAIFSAWPGPAALPALAAALALVVVNGVWVALLFGLLCARFRDVPPVMVNLMQLAFFITPIIWHPSLLAGRQRFVLFNPFYHFVEVIRAPLLGQPIAASTWAMTIGFAVLGWAVTLLLLVRYRKRIVYWL